MLRCVFLLFFVSTLAFADASASYIEKARARKLASETLWKRSLYYTAGDRSLTVTKDFFVSKNPQVDSAEELELHLQSLFAEPSPDHVLCRFPARSRWLIRELHIPKAQLPQVSCPNYERFKRMVYPKSVWITFASYYLNSPSSSYGHTLLRLSKTSPKDFEKQQSELLDYAVTFGANVDTENAILYAYKGLFGGFTGSFAALPYYFKIREYNDFESRDLWSYNIDLNEEQTERLVDLLWELDGTHLPYYFLSKNCSFYLLALLEAVDQDFHFLDQVPSYVIPIETIKALYKRPGFVRNVSYRASNRRQFWDQLERLSPEDQHIYKDLIKIDEARMPVLAYDDTTQVHLLDTALAQFDYTHARDLQEGKGPLYEKKHRYLLRRSQIPITSPVLNVIPQKGSEPHLGHSPEKWSLGLGFIKDSKDIFDRYLEADYRFSFHSWEDTQEGHFASTLTMLDLKLRYYTEGSPRLRLHKATFVEIFSLFPVNAFEQKGSWKMEFSFNDFLEPECYHCYGVRTKGAYGWAYEPLGGLILYALGAARIDVYDHASHLRVSPALGPQVGVWSKGFTNSDTVEGEFSREYLPLARRYEGEPFVSTTALRYSFGMGFARLHLSYERKDTLNAFQVRFSRFL
jgi:hypothetical protein